MADSKENMTEWEKTIRGRLAVGISFVALCFSVAAFTSDYSADPFILQFSERNQSFGVGIRNHGRGRMTIKSIEVYEVNVKGERKRGAKTYHHVYDALGFDFPSDWQEGHHKPSNRGWYKIQRNLKNWLLRDGDEVWLMQVERRGESTDSWENNRCDAHEALKNLKIVVRFTDKWPGTHSIEARLDSFKSCDTTTASTPD